MKWIMSLFKSDSSAPVPTALNFGVDHISMSNQLTGKVPHIVSGRTTADLVSKASVFSPCAVIFTFRLPHYISYPSDFEPWIARIITRSLEGRNPVDSSAYHARDTQTGIIRLKFSRMTADDALRFCRSLENSCTAQGGRIN